MNAEVAAACAVVSRTTNKSILENGAESKIHLMGNESEFTSQKHQAINQTLS